MKKIFIFLPSLFFLIFATHLVAFEPGVPGASRSEIRGDQEYTGNFVGFRGNEIQIALVQTGYRVSLPLAGEVEYLHKDNNYALFNPKDIFPEAPVKAIEVDGKIVQVIMLWELPR